MIDIMSLKRWKSIADQIHEKFGFNGTVYKKDNYVLAKSEEWANKVCPAIKSGDSVFVCSSLNCDFPKLLRKRRSV